jgi:hypothetical protein
LKLDCPYHSTLDKSKIYASSNKLAFSLAIGNPSYEGVETPDPFKFFIPDEELKRYIAPNNQTVLANTPITFNFNESTYKDISNLKEISIDGSGQKYPNLEIN